MGGDCLNYGCVPSKALLAAAGTRGMRERRAVRAHTAARRAVDFARSRACARRDRRDRAERFEGALHRPGRAGDRGRRALSRRRHCRGRRLRDQGAPLRDRHRLAARRAADPGPRRDAVPHQRDDLRPQALPRASDHHRRRARSASNLRRRSGGSAPMSRCWRRRRRSPRTIRNAPRSCSTNWRARVSTSARASRSRASRRSGRQNRGRHRDAAGRGDDRGQRSAGRHRPPAQYRRA